LTLSIGATAVFDTAAEIPPAIKSTKNDDVKYKINKFDKWYIQ